MPVPLPRLIPFVACCALLSLAAAPPTAPTVADGSIPSLYNPEHPLGPVVGLDWNANGDLWVLESRSPSSRSQIRILSDRDRNGVADHLTTFAPNLPPATAFLADIHGAYLATGSQLWRLTDSDGDGRMDSHAVVLDGFATVAGSSPIRTLRWGQDGWVHFSHRTDAVSAVRTPGTSASQARPFRGGIGRFHPKSGRFQIFADGGGNTSGMDIDSLGQVWLQDSGGTQVFAVLPGGVHPRSTGKPVTTFHYGERPGIQPAGKFLGGGPGFAIAPDSAVASAWLGNLFETSSDQSRLLVTRVLQVGATWIQKPQTSRDAWLQSPAPDFRIRTLGFGPDDALWVASSTGREKPGSTTHIWRIQPPSGRHPTFQPATRNPEALDSTQWTSALAQGSDWTRRVAIRFLTQRGALGFGPRQFHYSTPLEELVRNHPENPVRVAALWAMHGAGLLEDGHVLLEDVVSSNRPPVLAAMARIDGERSLLLMHTFKRLDQLASHREPAVRLATLVAARQLTSADPVVDLPPSVPLSEVAPGGIFSSLYFSTARHPDPDIEYLYWHAVEPLIAYDPAHAIGFYWEDGGRKQGFGTELLRKILRRAAELDEQPVFDRAIESFGRIPQDAEPGLLAGLQGLLEADGHSTPSPGARAPIEKLRSHPNPTIARTATAILTRWTAPPRAMGSRLNIGHFDPTRPLPSP